MNKKQLNRKLASINIQRDIGYTYSTTLEGLKRDVWNACKKNGFEFVRVEYAKTMNDGSSSVRIICKKPNPSSKQRKGEFLVAGCTAGISKRGILKGQKTYGIIYSCDMLSAHEISENRKRYSEEFINAIKTIETKYPTLGATDRDEWKRRIDSLCSIDNPRRHFEITDETIQDEQLKTLASKYNVSGDEYVELWETWNHLHDDGMDVDDFDSWMKQNINQ